MKVNKVFISAPINTAWSTVTEFCVGVRSQGGDPVLWDRISRYEQKDLDNADAVVFILPKNKFEATQNDLPVGLKSELSRAYSLNKDLFIGYITANGTYKIYAASSDGKSIKGVPGTTDSLERLMNSNVAAKAHKKMIHNSTYGAYAGKVFVPNPCDEVKLRTPTRVCAQIVSGHEFEYGFDERLLLAL